MLHLFTNNLLHLITYYVPNLLPPFTENPDELISIKSN